jgi:hypothetical protein
MCKLICVLIAPSDADVWCGSSDAAVLVCAGVWGLLSFIALILLSALARPKPLIGARPTFPIGIPGVLCPDLIIGSHCSLG